MAAKNKLRGTAEENRIVNYAEKFGMDAIRSWGSDGRSRGLDESVDVTISTDFKDYHVQVKKRKKIAKYLHIPEGCDVVTISEDYKKPVVVVPIEMFLDLIRRPI